MPWSEWITSTPRGWAAFAKRVQTSSQGQAEAGSVPEALAAAHAAEQSKGDVESTVVGTGHPSWFYAENHELAAFDPPSGVNHSSVTRSQQVHYYTAAAAGLPDLRDWYPPELWDLTEGVDYAVRPDRTGAEDDAYVEYDAGVAELVGWEASTSVQVVEAVPDQASVEVVVAALAPPQESAASGAVAATSPLWVAGATVLSVTGPAGYLSGSVDFSALAGTVPAVAVAVHTAGGGSYDGADEHRRLWDARMLPSVNAVVRFPRWRYWMPGPVAPPPLRQRQRNDGLGLSTARWRGASSRQRSIRWGGYL